MSMSCTCRTCTVFWTLESQGNALNRLLELEDPRHRPQLFLWCLSSLLDLLDDRYMSLCTRTCVLSTVLDYLVGRDLSLPLFWHVDTGEDAGTEIPPPTSD